MGAKRKESKVVDGQLSDSPKQNFMNLFIPKTEKATEKIEGDVDGIVAKLMDILKNKLRVVS
jgi:electron transfer flavoprotein beta subunit